MWRKDSKNWAYAPTASTRSETPTVESSSGSEDEDKVRSSKRKNKGHKRTDMFWSPPPAKRQRTSSAQRQDSEQSEKENISRQLYTLESTSVVTPTKRKAPTSSQQKSPLSQRGQQSGLRTQLDGLDNTASPVHLAPATKTLTTPLRKKYTKKDEDVSPTERQPNVEILGPTKPTSLRIDVKADEVSAIQNFVTQKLTGKRHLKLVGVTDEAAKVRQLLEQTIVAGEGNSMLLIGARGTGKSAVVENTIIDLQQEHEEEFHVVRLNGFIHTDDKLALREIWRQLGVEMDVEENSTSKNYADTLSTLLALLSHPAELAGEMTDHAAKSVIFVLDEFDQFTHHPRQTLLYNLFDIAQARKAPIAVLGLTTRIDVAENLEKRVKSRFTHRYIHFGLPQSLSVLQQICQQALWLDESGLDGQALNKVRPEYIEAWNTSVKDLLQHSSVMQALSRVFYSSKSISAALMTFLLPVVALSVKTPLLAPADIVEQLWTTSPDSKLEILTGLPALALTMLVAAARLEVILDNNSCNFHMAYEEYGTIAGKARINNAAAGSANAGLGGRVWGRAPARAAWERLIHAGLLVPVVGGAESTSINDMCRCDIALTEIEDAVPDLDKTLVRWVRSI